MKLRHLFILLAAYAVLILLAAVAGQAAAPSRIIVEIDGVRTEYVPASQPTTGDAGTTRPATPETRPSSQPSPVPTQPVPTQPVPTQPAPTQPAQPPLVRRTAAPFVEGKTRGDGLVLKRGPDGRATASRVVIAGFEQAVVAENLGKTPVDLEDVHVLGAYRREAADWFVGQAIYLEACGPVTIRGGYSEYAGWVPGAPPSDRNAYRHGVYHNFDAGPAVIEERWIHESAACGIQSRAGVIIRRCLITRAAIGVAAMMGPCVIEDSTIYDGHHYWQPSQKDAQGRAVPPVWTANVAIMAYWPVTLKNVWIVGHPDQAVPDLRPDLKAYNLGAIVGSSHYGKPQWKPAPGADKVTVIDGVIHNRPDGRTDPGVDFITAIGDCRIIGWPGPTYAGDRPTAGRGITVTGNPVDVRQELKAIRADLLAERITAYQAAARGQMAVRDAATEQRIREGAWK